MYAVSNDKGYILAYEVSLEDAMSIAEGRDAVIWVHDKKRQSEHGAGPWFETDLAK